MRTGTIKHHTISETRLDLALALKIAANGFLEPPGDESYANLQQFRSIQPEAIRYLSQFAYTWVAFGLEYLDTALAREIAAWQVKAFNFKDGMDTSAAALCCFERCGISLSFGDIGDALNQESAAALSRSGDYLSFTAEELRPEIAALLANHRGWLEISLKLPVEPETMKQFAAHYGEQCQLYLNPSITLELLAPFIESEGKRYLDLSDRHQRVGYENALLLCNLRRHGEIMSFLDLSSAMDLGPVH